ncbi:hypothetical protein [Nocardioides sambongensis]|uniref:hypothetical protein n=1 Tax=Nocardioides sambongensis TaxID=2589074 RepID=UPI001129103B|nr:hypothetical protein [Nocardioides sambongensis]
MDVVLRRAGSTLVVVTPYDFGTGDPFAGSLGDFLRTRAERVSGGVITDVAWDFDPKPKVIRRDKTTDLDIYAPGDPSLPAYAALAGRLRDRIPATPPAAREAVGALRLVGASAHRLWLAAPSIEARDTLGKVPGARAALVTAIQAVQRHEVPLYRVIVDPSYRGKRVLI